MIRFSKFLVVVICFSCSKELSVRDFNDYIYNNENGLTKHVVVEGEPFVLTAWPSRVLKNNIAQHSLFYFELKSNNTDKLFRLSEANFKIEGEEDIYPSLVFAENFGSSQKNHLLIGFPKSLIKGDIQFKFLNDIGAEISSAQFARSDVKKLENLKIKP